MVRLWLNAGGRTLIAVGGGILIALAQGSTDVAYAFVWMAVGVALGSLMTALASDKL